MLSVSLRAQCLVTVRAQYFDEKNTNINKDTLENIEPVTSHRTVVAWGSIPRTIQYGFVFPSSHSVEISPSRHPLNSSLRVLFVFFVTVFWFFDLFVFNELDANELDPCPELSLFTHVSQNCFVFWCWQRRFLEVSQTCYVFDVVTHLPNVKDVSEKNFGFQRSTLKFEGSLAEQLGFPACKWTDR